MTAPGEQARESVSSSLAVGIGSPPDNLLADVSFAEYEQRCTGNQGPLLWERSWILSVSTEAGRGNSAMQMAVRPGRGVCLALASSSPCMASGSLGFVPMPTLSTRLVPLGTLCSSSGEPGARFWTGCWT